jgi:hypothetical protein
VRPTWLVDSLAALMLLTAVYCVGRLVVARMWDRTTHIDVDIAHVAMGVAMAGMLVPSLRSLPAGVWEVVFAAMSCWFAFQIAHFVRRWGVRGWDDDHLHHASHYVTHLAMAAAMLYMFVALPTSALGVGMACMSVMASQSSSATSAGLPLVFAFILLVAAVWYGDGLTRFARARTAIAIAGEPTELVVASAVGVAVLDTGIRSPEQPVPSVTRRAEQTIRPGPRARTEQAMVSRWRLTLAGDAVLCAQDRRWLAPRLEIATHIAMCFTMGYMLIVMR